MGFFKKLFNIKPNLPNIKETEKVIDWLIRYDDKTKDFRNKFDTKISDLKEEILYELKKYDNASELKQNIIILSSIYHSYIFPEALKRYDNNGLLPDDTEKFYISLMYQESWLSAKLRIEGYFLLKKYGIQFQNSSNILINYKEKIKQKYLNIANKMSLSKSKAEELFQTIYKDAKKLSIENGTAILPILYGDYILEKEKNGEKLNLNLNLNMKRSEGVTDEDIRNWYNIVDIERKAMIKEDELFRFVTFVGFIKKGMNKDKATRETRKIHPFYGDPNDETHVSGKDRPLPYELKLRVNNYDEKMRDNNPEKYKKRMERFTSYNTFIRKELELENI